MFPIIWYYLFGIINIIFNTTKWSYIFILRIKEYYNIFYWITNIVFHHDTYYGNLKWCYHHAILYLNTLRERRRRFTWVISVKERRGGGGQHNNII